VGYDQSTGSSNAERKWNAGRVSGVTVAAPAPIQSVMPEKPRVFVIDDDLRVRRSLKFLLESAGLAVEIFPSAKTFLQRPLHDGPSCLVLDLRMPELNGLDVQEHLARSGIRIPIVFLSGYADVPSTAKAMRDGAIDFLVKPVDDTQLLEAVGRALERDEELRRRRREQTELATRIARLTEREREVIDLVARGLLNKQIAYELGISDETVKVHRGRAMRKLEVDSVASLVHLLDRIAP
jgi:RNA polymerase sigma factor (sigma-70 family)